MQIEVSEEAGVRYLHFGSRLVQGAMRVARPWALELEYTREMMLPLVLREPPFPRRVLLIGLGAASVLKFLYRHRPRAHLTAVEIEPRVHAVARHAFRLPDDPARIAIEIADGASYLACTERRHDWIVVDGFDARGRSGRLDSEAFYANCRACLAHDGLLTLNLLGESRRTPGTLARVGDAFAGRVLALPKSPSGNVIAVAAVGSTVDTTLGDLRTAAHALRRATGLNLAPTLARLTEAGAPGERFAL